MLDLLKSYKTYLSGLWKYRVSGLVAMLITGVLGIIITVVLPGYVGGHIYDKFIENIFDRSRF